MLPIHWAASDGKLVSLQFFLDHRQDINAQDGNGCSPVVIATQYNQITAVAYLIKQKCDLTLRDGNGDTALHWAAYKGYEELVGLLMHCQPHHLDTEDIFGQVLLPCLFVVPDFADPVPLLKDSTALGGFARQP